MKRFDREWGEQKALFGDGMFKGEDSMSDLQSVMWDCDDVMLILFDYYGSLNSDGRISSITFNEWGMFVEDFQLIDDTIDGCSKAALDRLFIMVDTKASQVAREAEKAAQKAGLGKEAGAIAESDEKRALKRVEFVTILVHVAVIKFVKTRKAKGAAEGLQRLMHEVIDPLVDYDLLPDPNLFRRSCYVKAVSEPLSQHAESLRCLHTALCEVEFGLSAKRLGIKAWLAALRALDLLGIDLSERECTLCFVWSRMASAKTPPTRQDECLPFEGFMEALCRLAAIKVLPKDEEIAARGCNDAGQYVQLMNSAEETRKEWEATQRTRKIGWGGTTDQPLDRCVTHTLWMVVRSVELACKQSGSLVDESNGLLSTKEVTTWLMRQVGDKA